MKYLVVLVSICISLSFQAQNTVQLSKSSDFITIKDGKVTIEMTPINPLTESELSTIKSWATSNAQVLQLEQNGSEIILHVNGDGNDRNIYLKLWYQMGVSFIDVPVNGSFVRMTPEQTLSKFGL